MLGGGRGLLSYWPATVVIHVDDAYCQWLNNECMSTLFVEVEHIIMITRVVHVSDDKQSMRPDFCDPQ